MTSEQVQVLQTSINLLAQEVARLHEAIEKLRKRVKKNAKRQA